MPIAGGAAIHIALSNKSGLTVRKATKISLCRVSSCTTLGDVTTADKSPWADAVYSMHSAPLLWCAVARISIKTVPAAAAGVRLRPSPASLSPQKRDQLDHVVQLQRAAATRGMQPMTTLEALMLG